MDVAATRGQHPVDEILTSRNEPRAQREKERERERDRESINGCERPIRSVKVQILITAK